LLFLSHFFVSFTTNSWPGNPDLTRKETGTEQEEGEGLPPSITPHPNPPLGFFPKPNWTIPPEREWSKRWHILPLLGAPLAASHTFCPRKFLPWGMTWGDRSCVRPTGISWRWLTPKIRGSFFRVEHGACKKQFVINKCHALRSVGVISHVGRTSPNGHGMFCPTHWSSQGGGGGAGQGGQTYTTARDSVYSLCKFLVAGPRPFRLIPAVPGWGGIRRHNGCLREQFVEPWRNCPLSLPRKGCAQASF